jgi:hypothetical protein
MKKRAIRKSEPRKNWQTCWIIGAIFAVSLLAYSNSFTAGFVLDNKALILEDARVHEATSQNVADIFKHTYWWPTGESGLYRPFTTLSYLFNYAVLGDRDQPADYHWINLVLHALNATLLYFLMLRLTSNVSIAAFSAILWAIHPVLTEAVTNIVGRADLLVTTAVLGGLLIYFKISESAGWLRALWLLGLMAITAVGVFSKESGAVIVGVIGLYELTWWKERAKTRPLILWAAAAIVIPLELLLYRRSLALASSPPADFPYFDNPITGAGFWMGRLTALKVIGHYLMLIVWPVKLACDYSYNQISLVTGAAADWVWLALVAAVGAGVLYSFRKNRTVFFLMCLAFLTILPASNLLFPAGTIMAERLVYLPSAAVLGCLVIGVYAIANRFGNEKAAPVILCLIACAFAARTWARNQDWQDDLSLARSTVAVNPASFKAHQMLAVALFQADPEHRDLDGVLSEAERGIAILNPLPDQRNSADLYRLAGACYLLKGDRLRPDDAASRPSPEVAEQYRKALPVLQRGAAIMKATRERERERLKVLGKPELAFGPSSNDDVYRLLSVAYLRLGSGDNAFEAVAEGRKQDPLNPEMYGQMAEVLLAAGDAEQAAAALMEGMLVTSDMSLRKQLIELYGKSLGPKSCAVMNGPNGAALNPQCEIVHRQLCDVAADVVKIDLYAGRKKAAESLKRNFLGNYGCPAGPLNSVLPN